jgi:WD40 repeat protein
MSPLRCFCVAFVLAVSFQSLSAGEHHTLRYLYEDSRVPISAKSLAVSPDSKEAALGLDDGVVHFIRLADGEQTSEIQALPFDMKYCRDGSRILMLSEYEAFTLSTSTRSRTKVNTSDVPGYVGLMTVNRNGKLIVDSTVDGSPARLCNELQRGDEIVSLGDGKSGEMRDVVGMPSTQFASQMKGPVGTYVRVSLLKKNGETTEPILLRRSPAVASGTSAQFATMQKQTIGETLMHFQRDYRHTFVSAFDGKCIGALNTEDVNLVGQHAVSPDQTLFAVLSYTLRSREQYGIEIYDLTSLERRHYISFNRPSFNSIAFSADGRELFAGSHNRIDVYDVVSGGFERGLVGTSATPMPTPIDKKREEPISGTAASSVFGAASDSVGEFSVSETRIEKIAVTTSLVAVAVPGGALELWDAKTGAIRTAIAAPKHGTRQYMTPKIDLMQFSPDGRWLVYYIEGIFNIVDVSEFSEPSTGSQEK